ncbi:MAG: potassium-transporting ATPase subunit KdpA [Acidobacteria bacterium]|nr:MAG: potassium-transporting ATPase subunit KdpA [Acidobacteriota bacterium]
MTPSGVLYILVFFLVLLAVTKPLGLYMAHIYEGRRSFLHPVLRPLERLLYRVCGIREDTEQRWTQYAASLLVFSVVSFFFVYMIQRLQGFLPLNPMGFSTGHAPGNATAMTPDLAFNTAVSFMTNTNWQSYGGEITLSYLVQMVALTVQNFVSAAAGIAVAIALIRGFARKQADTIGNFWVDLTRGTVYIMLPLCFVFALFLCARGVPQTLNASVNAKTLEGPTQTIAVGPVASQEAPKMLGTNGGGFFNTNSAHPFENPTPLTNFVELLSILAIASGLTYTFGKMVGDTRQGWGLFAAMAVLFFAGVFVCYGSEGAGNPILAHLGVSTAATREQPGGNMEGKEVRFGNASSALWATATTDASNGSVNSMHDSYTPIGGLVSMFNLQTDEVIFGGVGSGLYGILLYAIVGVFIAGLMVGRTPEYLGKKIEQKEVKMAMVAIIVTAFAILVFSAICSVAKFPAHSYWNPPGPAAANLSNAGPHGFSEILYTFSSASENNGSAFAGINANTPWYNLLLGLAMLIGRFGFMIPALAVAGSLATKKKVPVTSGTLPTHGALWVGLLVATIVIVGALTFFPALSLGPIVEQFLMHQGKTFSLLIFPAWS